MSAGERRRFTVTEQNRRWLASLIDTSPVGYSVIIEPARRSPSQNDIFHALVAQIAKAVPEYKGIPMDAERWKALIIVSHAIAKREAEGEQPIALVPDLEGTGMVQLRESYARMPKPRATSLIEYTLKVGGENGVQFKEAA